MDSRTRAAGAAAQQKDPKTGRFLTGNNGGGRPKGARNKLAEEFFADLYADWKNNGAETIRAVRENHPRDYLRVCAMLMPKEFKLEQPLQGLSDAELANLIGAVKSLLPETTADDIGVGNEAAIRPH
jgi:hypothetical protein